MKTNPQIELARRYVEQTGMSIFLTGKAGTGKTTFLHEVAAQCPKRHAIIAPTGVAAINAGGVTIHSFFQLPFDPYLPDVKELVTEYQMPESRKSLSKNKINIIRTLELLIIDEISMVRADLLDAIDMTLRRYRRSSRPFGGVQLLMIGDVHQLSPVVTETERPFMEKVYPTPYFFASKALQRIPYVTIELTTVYRQQDAAFVDLLNHVRDNNIDPATLQALNSRVNTNTITQSHNNAIVLTTHNRQADAINRRQMEALKGEQRTFEALLKGNYPEKSLPCDHTLEIKVGERVMFVKNDSSRGHRYYNGMLGTVTEFRYDDEDKKEYIEVINDDGDTILTGRETWESLKYKLNDKTGEIEQEVEGTFSQYPLQAAWAVTIHKAQGLTFDRVVIDAADAFAFGQVYVALSRCRTLEGLTLSTPLTSGVAFEDLSVSQFVNSQPSFEQTSEAAPEYERQYRLEKLMELFGMDDIIRLAERLMEHYGKLKNIYPANVERMQQLEQSLSALQGVSEKFKSQLMGLDETSQNERAGKGADYYRAQLQGGRHAYAVLLDVEVDNKENKKQIKEKGDALMEALDIKLACLEAVVKEGYSVAVVQRAKVKATVGSEGESEKRKAKSENQEGKSEKRKTKSEKQEEESEKRKAKSEKQEEEREKRKVKSERRDADAMPEEVPEELAPEPADLEPLLRQWRADKAKELGVPTYMVLQQKALVAIVANQPHTLDELANLPGIGPSTINRYGKEILDLLAEV